jgi:hypothetical protein
LKPENYNNGMGQPSAPNPVLRIMAAFSRYEAALAWARDRAVAAWGPIALESPPFEFNQTGYYDATMGPGLRKVFFAFAELADPAGLAEWKLTGNAWEAEYAAAGRHPEPRPLNLDPGYLTLGKLVLASTKDYAHRVYLRQGIFAEITLYWRRHRWEHHEWTFADYRQEAYHVFFSQCREYLHKQLREVPAT